MLLIDNLGNVYCIQFNIKNNLDFFVHLIQMKPITKH